jgi:hypothetical protein
LKYDIKTRLNDEKEDLSDENQRHIGKKSGNMTLKKPGENPYLTKHPLTYVKGYM